LKLKKIAPIIVVLAIIAVGLLIYVEKSVPNIEWDITVKTGSTVKTISFKQLYKMESITIEATLVKSTGKKITNKWTGAPLQTFLKEAGVSDFKQLIFIAEDGYMVSLSKQELEGAILAYKKDGSLLSERDGKPVRLVVPNQPGSTWVKYVKEIVVVTGGPTLKFEGKVKVKLEIPLEYLKTIANYEVTVEKKGKTVTYKGVRLLELLDKVRILDDAVNITFIAEDGYQLTLPLEEVFNMENAIITVEDNSFRLIIPDYSSKYWVKKLVKIVIS